MYITLYRFFSQLSTGEFSQIVSRSPLTSQN